MFCPFCNHSDTNVKDSRQAEEGNTIRRRRQCPACKARFTTYERVQLRELNIVKNGGQVERFDRDKLTRSMSLCLQKRPVNRDQIEKIVSSITRRLESSGEAEIPSVKIGEMVMEALAELDQVAYVRYASVYKDFQETKDFNEFLDDLKKLPAVNEK